MYFNAIKLVAKKKNATDTGLSRQCPSLFDEVICGNHYQAIQVQNFEN